MRLLPARRRTDDERAGSMTLVEHLTELRRRVIYALYAIVGGAMVGWFLWNPFLDLIRQPYCEFLRTHPDQSPGTGCTLVFLGPFDGFTVRMKSTLFIGLAIALPVVLFQLWAFIAPGLTAREKKWSIPFVVSSFVLFCCGGVLAYFVLPKSLDFLLGFAGESVQPTLTVDRYVGFVTLVTLAFGLSFLFPVILVFLQLVGLVTPRTLGRYRRYAILGISLISAIITPGTDVVSMLAMMIPMYLFYEAAIIIGRSLTRGREDRDGDQG
jgi:sec-independent protein translocase protein TatC